MITVYNGIKYKIKVFSRKINSLIGPINLDTGESNVPHTFSDGYVIYGEKTIEKNYTEVIIPTLKHHKSDYINAVRTQLLYFNNVKFLIEDEGEDGYEYEFKADVIYNSKNLIVSNNSPYSKPHVVIVKGGDNVETQTGVSYGYIDFKEMELEEMYGDVGIKCPIRQVYEDEDGNEIELNPGIEVVPSRESVRWTPATREFLKKQFLNAQIEAGEIIEKELRETDLVKWLESCRGINSGIGGTVISRLSRIVDLDSVKPKFNKTNIEFGHVSQFFSLFNVYRNTKVKRDGKLIMNTEEVKSWNEFKFKNVFLKEGSVNKLTSLFINDTIQDNFITIHPKTETAVKLMTPTKMSKAVGDSWVQSRLRHRDRISALLEASAQTLSYDEVEVTDAYKDSLSKIEQKLATDKAEAEMSNADRRALEEKVVCHALTPRYVAYRNDNEITESFQRSKREERYADIKDYQGKLYYGHKVDSSKLHFAAHVLNRNNLAYCNSYNDREENLFFNEHSKVVYIANNNKKHFKSHSHIDDFFGKEVEFKDSNDKVVGTQIVMDNAIVHWNTARKIKDDFSKLDFLWGFSDIDNEVHTDYLKIRSYLKRYHSDLTGYRNRFGVNDHYDDFIAFIDKVEVIQNLSDASDTEGLKDFLEEQKLSNNIVTGLAVNTEMLAIFDRLLVYATPLNDLLNEIPALTENENISQKLSMYVADILSWKNSKY